MQTLADMRGVGVKNRGKLADVICGRPLTALWNIGILLHKQAKRRTIMNTTVY